MAITLTRREFVRTAVSATTASLVGCSPTAQPSVPPDELVYATVHSRPRKPTEKVSRGFQALRLGTDRDGFLYVPPSYAPEKATPLIVLLHGAGRHSSDWSSPRFAGFFDDPPIIVIAPDSRASTWDVLYGGYGPDVRFIDESLELVFNVGTLKTSSSDSSMKRTSGPYPPCRTSQVDARESGAMTMIGGSSNNPANRGDDQSDEWRPAPCNRTISGVAFSGAYEGGT